MARRNHPSARTTDRRPEDWFPPARPTGSVGTGDLDLKADKVTQVIAGAGLTGGGTLAADRTFNVGAGTGITVNADDVAIDTTAEAERIRDVVGAALTAGSNITITVNDGADTITIDATGGSGVPSGTSFPGSPSNNDLFYRTDRDILYFFDGTRWLSVHQHQLRFLNTAGVTADAVNDYAVVPYKGIYDLWLETWQAVMLLTAGSASWTWNLRYRNSANASTDIAGVSVTTPAANVWTNGTTAINALLSSNAIVLENSFDETAGAAAMHGGATLYYRLVG